MYCVVARIGPGPSTPNRAGAVLSGGHPLVQTQASDQHNAAQAEYNRLAASVSPEALKSPGKIEYARTM
jgi:hypothetical protein